MAFTEADRVQIRQYVGWSAIFLQYQPLLESAITTVQAKADGGSRDDNSTELLIKGLIVQLQAIDAKILNTDCLGTNQVGNIQQDNIRALMIDRQNGRMLVGRLCTVLSLEGPLSDCFSSLPPGPPRLGFTLGGGA